MPTIDHRLEELVRQGQDLLRRGEPVSVEDLCRTCPELVEDLRRRLQALPSTGLRADTSDVNPPAASRPDSDDLRPGSEPVAGYMLVQRLGRGGYGEVWKASGPGGFFVALKFVPLATEGIQVEQRALDIIKTLRHPNLLSTVGSWQTARYLVIAMELADGTLLDRYQQAVAQGLPGIPRDELVEYLHQAAMGIDFLNGPQNQVDGHERGGVQHRDIKPENILLAGNGVKVADFGLVCLLEHTQTGHTGSLTPHYAAPEFFEGHTSQHSDQYSLAITYCHLRSGRMPFGGSVAAILRGHLMQVPDLSMLPPQEQPIVARALSKPPTDRWPSCLAFVNALRGSTIQVRQVSPRPVRHRIIGLAMLGGAALILLVILGINGGLSEFQSPEPSDQATSHGADAHKASVAARELAEQAEKSAEQARQAYETLVAEFAAAGQVAEGQSATKAWKAGKAALAAAEAERALAQFESARNQYEQATSRSAVAQKASAAARQNAEQAEKSAVSARQDYESLVAEFPAAGQVAEVRSAAKTWETGKAALTAADFERALAQFELSRSLYEQAMSRGGVARKTYVTARHEAEQAVSKAATSLKEWEAAMKSSLAAIKAPPAALGKAQQTLQEATRQLARGEFGGAAQNSDKVALLLDQAREQVGRTLAESRSVAVAISSVAIHNTAAPAPQKPTPTPFVPAANGREMMSASTGMMLVLIPAGTFTMGSAADEKDRSMSENPPHFVKISQAFYMGVHEVTQGEYEKVIGTNPSYFSSTGSASSDVSGQDTNRFPVEQVSWYDTVEYCNKLSVQDGLPAYYGLTRVERQYGYGTIRSASVIVVGGTGYRLPTEAEWEYSCRAGTTSAYHTGSSLASLDQAGWYGAYSIPTGNSEKRTNRVGQKTANAFGLFDMHGNVWEWCDDIYDAKSYSNRSGTTVDPLQTSESRVLRGGSWNNDPWNTRSAHRFWFTPDDRSINIGFRISRTP